MTIRRFGFWHDKHWEGEPGEFEEMPSSPYVLYSDHLERERVLREALKTVTGRLVLNFQMEGANSASKPVRVG